MSEGKTVLFEMPDISAYQGYVDMKAVRDSGYGHIGIRAGYGRNNVDQKYISNAQACVQLDMRVLLYWFSYAYTVEMAAEEAGFAVAQARKYWRRCPIAFDLEQDTRRYAATRGVDIDKKLATDMAAAFLREVRTAGYIPVIYTNRDFRRSYIDMDRITAEAGKVYVWLALYGIGSLPASELAVADLWQYTSGGSIPGITGKADISRVYTDIWSGGASGSAATTATTATEYGSYTVVKGDSLSKIGKKLGVAWTEIASANNIRSPYTIYPGQKLRIPYRVSVSAPEKESGPNPHIRSFQEAANRDGYRDAQGRELAENGMDDTATRFVGSQVSLQARRPRPLWVERSEGEVVRWLQGRLRELLEVGLEITGEYDDGTVAAVREFQRRFGLGVDGIAGYNTIRQMF